MAFTLFLMGLLNSCGGSSHSSAPSGLSYPQTAITATVGAAITTDTPTVTGTVTSWSVIPSLPPGLILSTTTGAISGTPTAVATQASYKVTAANSAGSTTENVQITVSAALQAPSGLSYPQTTITATVGTAIATDTPTVTGTVTSWSVIPSLPPGLSLSTTTGAISGTPTAASAQASYKVTAANSAGSTTENVQITVNAVLQAPSGLNYPAPTIAALSGQAITTDTPTVVGTVTQWSVLPSLPTGLSLNPSTGAIGGTPSAASASASYTVKAANAGGWTTAVVQIAVVAATVDQVVHATAVSSHQSYHAALGYVVPVWSAVLPSTSSIKTTLAQAVQNRRRLARAAARATPEDTTGLTYEDDFGLYVSSFIQTGNTFAINLYADAAGTVPAGAITGTFPDGILAGSYSSVNFPISIPLTINITAGKMPCTGSGTLVMLDSAPSGTFQGSMTLTKIGLSVTANLALDDNLNITGSITMAENGEQYTLTNIQGAPNGTISASVVVMPQNYTGTANVSILDGTSSMILNTPNGVATADTGTDGILKLQYPDGSTETISDPNDTQPNAPPSASTSGPSNLSYALPSLSATQLFLMVNDTPVVTGTVTAWSINPALPAGLTINSASGIISGTPTAVSPQTNYVVTASNASGFTQGTVQITVVPVPAPMEIDYPQTSITAGFGTAITADTPTALGSGGSDTVISRWGILPALPTGLTLDPSSGTISGTPTAVSPQTTYTVTGSNPSGSMTATVQISVASSCAGAVCITYPVTNIVTSVDQAITPDVPILVGSFTTFYISPDLPYGMSLDPATGAISGTPIAQMPPTTYLINAYTANYGVGTNIQITVNEPLSQGIVAQDSIFAGSTLNLASFPSTTAQSFEWSLTDQTSGGTITAGSTSDLIQYTANTTPGTYQLSVSTQAASGNSTTVSRTLNVVSHQFLKDPATSWDRGTPTASLLANGTILFVGSAEDVGSANLMAGSAVNSTEIFDPLSGTFSAAATMALPRKTGQAQVTFANGKVLVCGGLSELIDAYSIYETSASLAETEIYDPAANAWTTVASMNVARSGHTATLLQNGKVLVAGGTDQNGSVLNSAEIYDPAANTWTAAANLTTTRTGPSAILLNDGTVLVTGGTDSGGNWLNSAEIYNPVANTWTAAGSMQATSGYTSTLLKSGKVLFAGGLTNDGYGNLVSINTAQIYDPVAGTWSSATSMSAALTGHTATLLSTGTVLVAGGEAGSGYFGTASAAIYDPVANTWSSVASLNLSRYNHLAFTLPNGNVVVAYGATSYESSSAMSNGSAETYNPAANTWTPTGMTAPLGDFSATLLANGQVLFAGGGSGEVYGFVTSLAQTFNPATNTWSIVAPLNTARENHTATLLQNGKLLVVGGDVAAGIGYSTHSAVLSSVELYDPAANTWTAEASLITGRTQHTATLLQNGKVLVAGGLDSNGNLVSTAELYDPNANSWAAAGSLVNPRYQHTATLLNTGKVLLAGGLNGTYSGGYIVPLGAAELYDPSANTWTAAAVMPAGVYGHTATVQNNGTLAITGGYAEGQNGFPAASAGLQLYNPTANSWSQGASMNEVRTQHAATLLSSGQVLVTGGIGISSETGYSQTVSPSEIYTPSSNTWTLGAPLNLPRYGHFSILLNDGRVMIVGGEFSSYIPEFWKE